MDVVFRRLRWRVPADGSPDAVRLDLRGSDATGWVLWVNDLPLTRLDSPGHLVTALENLATHYASHRTETCAVLHAGAVAFEDAGVLIAGESGSGKSTVTLTLALNHGRYLGDELVFIGYGDRLMRPFPKAGTLKAGSFDLFPEAATHQDAARGPKRFFLPPGAAALSEAVPVSLILFPLYHASGLLESTRLPRPAVALALVQQFFGGVADDARKRDVLEHLSRVPGYAVQYTACKELPQVVRDLLRSR